MPEVTILLPTYNRSDLIPNCIKSVIDQSFTNWELIILDDGSTDNTEKICQPICDSKIIYHKNNKTLGTPLNRNVGISLSSSDWILFIEDDIIIDKDCLKNLMLNKVYGKNMPRLITNGKDDLHRPFNFNKFTGEIFNAHACCLYPRKALEEVGGYSSNFIGNYYREETDLDCRIKKSGGKFNYISSAIMYHNPVKMGSWKGMSNQTYFIHRNHLIYLIRNFGLKILYMIPYYLSSVVLQSIIRRLK